MENSFFFKFSKLIVLFLFLNISNSNCQDRNILVKLNVVIDSSKIYDQAKEIRINKIKKNLNGIKDNNLLARYNLSQQLFNEFKTYKRDSAFHYGILNKSIAIKMNDSLLISNANINLADICVSSGMYKEAIDFIQDISVNQLPVNRLSIFYGLLGRCYSDMAEYSNIPYFYIEYNKLAKKYREKAVGYTEEGTFYNSFLKAFNNYKNNNLKESINQFEAILKNNISNVEEALVNHMLADLYLQMNNSEQAILHFSKATIEDIKASTKESLAIIKLSELLFKKGDIKNASELIQKANQDALFYGAQQRKIQVGAILPLIEQEIVQIIEQEKRRIFIQYVLVSIFLLFTIGLASIIFFQYRKLKKARKIILKAHKEVKLANKELIEFNEKIKAHNIKISQINNLLLESNKIKEEYIGFFFTQYDDIFEKFSHYMGNIHDFLDEGNYEKVKYQVVSYNRKREKEKLLRNFDSAFIKLFPNFIDEFNSLMAEDKMVKLHKDEILNKELRIFALIRLGVKHNEIIAQILGYSVNSIYAYKTRIRNNSIVEKTEFDQKLLEITTLKL